MNISVFRVKYFASTGVIFSPYKRDFLFHGLHGEDCSLLFWEKRPVMIPLDTLFRCAFFSEPGIGLHAFQIESAAKHPEESPVPVLISSVRFFFSHCQPSLPGTNLQS